MEDDEDTQIIIIVLDDNEGDKEEEGRFHQLVEQRCAICNVAWFISEASTAKDCSDSAVQLKMNLLETLRQAYGFEKGQDCTASNDAVEICCTCCILAASLHSRYCQLKDAERMYDDAKSRIDCAVIRSINEDHVGEIYGEGLPNNLEYGGGIKNLRLLIYQDWLKRYGRNNSESQMDSSRLRRAFSNSGVKVNAVSSTIRHSDSNTDASHTNLKENLLKSYTGLQNSAMSCDVTMVLEHPDLNEWIRSACAEATDEQLPREAPVNCPGVANISAVCGEKPASAGAGNSSQDQPEPQLGSGASGFDEHQCKSGAGIANDEADRTSARNSNETSPDPSPVEGLHEEGNSNGAKPFTCEFCFKTYKQKHYFRYHVKTHTGEAPSCELCGKIFPTSSRVKRHMHVHKGERPFRCDACGKSYRNQRSLSAHRRAHSS